MEQKRLGLIKFVRTALSEPESLPLLIEGKGKIFPLKSIGSPVLHIATDPAYVEHVFLKNPHNYVRDPKLFVGFNDLFGDYGFKRLDIWEKDKKIILTLLTKEKMKDFTAIWVNTIRERNRLLDEYVDSKKPIYIDNHISALALNNLLNAIYGGVKIDIPETNHMVREIFYLMSPFIFPFVKLGFLPMPLYFRYKKYKNQMNEMSLDIVKQSFTNQVAPDNLIRALANGYGYGDFDKLNTEQKEHLLARAGMFIIAAYDSVSGSLVRAITALSLYPMVAEKVYEEVSTVLGQRDPTHDDIPKLVYTRGVIKEALRLYPPNAMIVRTCLQDDVLDGYKIKKNEIIVFPASATHKLAAYWDNPEGFDPARFLNPLTKDQQMMYMPFALGPEACIGGQFATVQEVLALAMLVQHYKLELTPGCKLTREPGLMNRLNQDVTMYVKRR